MSCIICNSNNNCTQSVENFPDDSLQKTRDNWLLNNFLDYFHINPGARFQLDLSPPPAQFQLCPNCKSMAQKLLDLNQKLEELKTSLAQTEDWFRSQIKNISKISSPAPKTRNDKTKENSNKRWNAEDARISSIRDLIAGPTIKLRKLNSKEVKYETRKKNNSGRKTKDLHESKIKAEITKVDVENVKENFEGEGSPGEPAGGSNLKMDFEEGFKLVLHVLEEDPRSLVDLEEEKISEEFPNFCEGETFQDGGDLLETESGPEDPLCFEDRAAHPAPAEDEADEAIEVDGKDETDTDFVLKAEQGSENEEEEDFEDEGSALKKFQEESPVSKRKEAIEELGEDHYLYHGKWEFRGNPRKGYQCSKCSNGWNFPNKMCLLKHLRNHIKNPSRRKVSLVTKSKIRRFEGEDRYIFDEQLEFTGNDTEGYSCSVCAADGWKFPNQERILRHFKIHLENKDSTGITKCPICGKVLMSPRGYKTHIKAHDESFILICEVCGKGCKGPKALRCHMRFNHRNVEYQECDVCGKKIKGDHLKLKYHKETVHLKTKKWVCEFCGIGFPYNESLRRHLQSAAHSTERNYSCEVCGEKFRQKHTHVKHMRRFHSSSLMSTQGQRQPSDHRSVVQPEHQEESEDQTLQDQDQDLPDNSNNSNEGLESLRCKLCGLQYHRLFHLNKHLLKIHHIDQIKELKGIKTGKSRKEKKPEVALSEESP